VDNISRLDPLRAASWWAGFEHPWWNWVSCVVFFGFLFGAVPGARDTMIPYYAICTVGVFHTY